MTSTNKETLKWFLLLPTISKWLQKSHLLLNGKNNFEEKKNWLCYRLLSNKYLVDINTTIKWLELNSPFFCYWIMTPSWHKTNSEKYLFFFNYLWSFANMLYKQMNITLYYIKSKKFSLKIFAVSITYIIFEKNFFSKRQFSRGRVIFIEV